MTVDQASPMLILASGSPRRAELLRQIGVSFTQQAADIDEHPLPGELPDGYVQRLALEKARAVLARQAPSSPLPVLGSDTSVVLAGQIFGKPASAAEAAAMLSQLAGATHEVLTAVALVDAQEAQVVLSRTRVTFRAISPAEMQAYWESGEPADKAGGYAIQGLGALFVSRIEGSYSGVMGLPLFETAGLLRDRGIPVGLITD